MSYHAVVHAVPLQVRSAYVAVVVTRVGGGALVYEYCIQLVHDRLPLMKQGIQLVHDRLPLMKQGIQLVHDRLPLMKQGIQLIHDRLPLMKQAYNWYTIGSP